MLLKSILRHQYFKRAAITVSNEQNYSLSTKSTDSSKTRRCLLYVPGHDQRKIDKVLKLNADCVVLDCEDGVGYHQKEEARDTIVCNYARLQQTYRQDVAIRINSLSSGLAKDDLNSIMSMPTPPSTIVIPKVDQTHDITEALKTINEAYIDSHGDEKPSCRTDIIFMTESGQGLINLKDIIETGLTACKHEKSCTRISGMIFGSDDYCADLGICRSNDGIELLYARQKIVAIAKAYRLQPIDMVYIDFKDPEGLKQQALQGSRFGFTGKQAIHPGQVDIIQSSFSPDPEKVEWADELLKAYQACSQGVFVFRGQMIDMPTILQAENIRKMQSYIDGLSKSEEGSIASSARH